MADILREHDQLRARVLCAPPAEMATLGDEIESFCLRLERASPFLTPTERRHAEAAMRFWYVLFRTITKCELTCRVRYPGLSAPALHSGGPGSLWVADLYRAAKPQPVIRSRRSQGPLILLPAYHSALDPLPIEWDKTLLELLAELRGPRLGDMAGASFLTSHGLLRGLPKPGYMVAPQECALYAATVYRSADIDIGGEFSTLSVHRYFRDPVHGAHKRFFAGHVASVDLLMVNKKQFMALETKRRLRTPVESEEPHDAGCLETTRG